jgi:hypothetical protein
MKQKNAGDINRSLTKLQRRALAEALEKDKPRLKTQTLTGLKERGATPVDTAARRAVMKTRKK